MERLPHGRRPLLICREEDFVLQHTIHVSIIPSTFLPNKFCGGHSQLRRSIFSKGGRCAEDDQALVLPHTRADNAIHTSPKHFLVTASFSPTHPSRRTARVGAIFHPTHTNASMNREEWPAAVTCPPASSHQLQADVAQDPSTHVPAIRQISKVSRLAVQEGNLFIEQPQQDIAHLAVATSCA